MIVDQVKIRGGRIEAFRLPGGTGAPLLVLGGVETGLRRLAGTEHLLSRRWAGRAQSRPVVVVGRPLPDADDETDRLMHPRVIADAVATAIGWISANGGPQPPYAVEAESGGGRISLWLAVDHPELVSRLVLSSVASETQPDSAMARRMAQWINLAEHDDWGMFFGHMAVQMRPADAVRAARGRSTRRRACSRVPPPRSASSGSCAPRWIPSSLRHRPPARRSTCRPWSWPAGRDQVVPPDATRQVAERTPPMRASSWIPECGHTVRSRFDGYQRPGRGLPGRWRRSGCPSRSRPSTSRRHAGASCSPVSGRGAGPGDLVQRHRRGAVPASTNGASTRWAWPPSPSRSSSASPPRALCLAVLGIPDVVPARWLILAGGAGRRRRKRRLRAAGR